MDSGIDYTGEEKEIYEDYDSENTGEKDKT